MIVITSKAKRPKNAWFLFSTKVAQKFQIEIGYRPQTGGRGCFSSSHQSAPVKVPWGPPTVCPFNIRRNGDDSINEYLFINERNESAAFDEVILSSFEVGKTPFANKMVSLGVKNKKKLLSLYITLAQHSLGFVHHKESHHDVYGLMLDGSGIGIEDVIKEGGSLSDYEQFLNDVKASASIIDESTNSSNKMFMQKLDARKNSSSGDNREVTKKKPRLDVRESEVQELIDPRGLEKQYQNSIKGVTFIPLSNLQVASELEYKINVYRVQEIKNSLLEKFDPSQSVLVVIPEDQTTPLNLKNASHQKFRVIQKIHTFRAFEEIEKDGLLSSLPSIKDKSLLCYVVNTTSSVLAHYGNLRENNVNNSFKKEVCPQNLISVFQDLCRRENKSVALKVIERMSKINCFGLDECTSVKRLCQMSDNGVDILVSLIERFEMYETLDIKVSGRLGAINRCERQRLTNREFNMLAKCDEKYIIAHSPMVLERKCSFVSMIENHQNWLKANKVYSVLSKLSGYVSKEKLKNDYPEQFDTEQLLKFAGAEIKGKAKNLQAWLLEDYYNKVVDGRPADLLVEMCPINDLSHFGNVEDNLKVYDFIVANLGDEISDFSSKLLSRLIKTDKQFYGALIIFSSVDAHHKSISFLKNNSLNDEGDIRILPVYFNNQSSKVKNELLENLFFGTIVGKFINPEKPLQRCYSDVASVSDIIRAICPPKSKVGVISSPGQQMIQVHSHNFELFVKYFGTESALEKLRKKLYNDKTMYNNCGNSNLIVSRDASSSSANEKDRIIPCYAGSNSNRCQDNCESSTSPIKVGISRLINTKKASDMLSCSQDSGIWSQNSSQLSICYSGDH